MAAQRSSSVAGSAGRITEVVERHRRPPVVPKVMKAKILETGAPGRAGELREESGAEVEVWRAPDHRGAPFGPRGSTVSGRQANVSVSRPLPFAMTAVLPPLSSEPG